LLLLALLLPPSPSHVFKRKFLQAIEFLEDNTNQSLIEK